MRIPAPSVRGWLYLEIEVVVTGAAGVEGRAARRAGKARREVVPDGEFRSTRPTEDGSLAELLPLPARGSVAFELLVAGGAGVVPSATLKLDGDDVEFAVIVDAASLAIDQPSMDRHHSPQGTSIS